MADKTDPQIAGNGNQVFKKISFDIELCYCI